MKFNQIEHYDCFDDETLFWAEISDLPAEIQNQAKEIDGKEFSPDCFGICIGYDLSESEFFVVTDTDYQNSHGEPVCNTDSGSLPVAGQQML